MHWFLHQLPSLGLTLWGAGVFILAGDKRRISWALGLTGQPFWASYAIWLAQWGLLIGCFFYGSVYVRNWLKWKPAATEPTPQAKELRSVAVDV